MAVVFFQEITGRSSSKDADSNLKYRRTWIARTSSPTDGAFVVRSYPGIPAFNAPYQYVDEDGTITDPNAVCVDVQTIQDNANAPQDWRVTADYVGIDDPTAQPAEVEYTPFRYQVSLVQDVQGKAVVNKAGDPFESGITADRTRFTLTITKAVLYWDAAAADEFNDSVNEHTFIPTDGATGFPAGTCKLVWGAKRVRRAGTNSFYWLRTSVIEINRQGWKIKVRNAGMKEVIYASPFPILGVTIPVGTKPIFDAPGVPATSPRLLDSFGRAIGPLAPHQAPPDPLQFDGYYVKSWATLTLQY